MKRATALPSYRQAKDFTSPEGVQSVIIDPESLELATPTCPTTRTEVYVAGSAPTQYCEIHGGHGVLAQTGSFLSHVFGGGSEPKPPQTESGANGQRVIVPQRANPPGAETQGKPASGTEADSGEKKKNVFQKFFGIFGGKKKDPDKDKDKPKPDKGDSP